MWDECVCIHIKYRATICASNKGAEEKSVIDHLETNMGMKTIEEAVASTGTHIKWSTRYLIPMESTLEA